MSTSTQLHDAKLVTQSFVRQYYHQFSENPSELHRFYQDDSQYQLNLGPEDMDVPPVTGQKLIDQKILSLGLVAGDVKVDLSNNGSMDFQTSENNGIIVTVTGWITLNANVPRKPFMQVFFLSCHGDRSFFILNDIFRFLPVYPEMNFVQDNTTPQVALESSQPIANFIDETLVVEIVATTDAVETLVKEEAVEPVEPAEPVTPEPVVVDELVEVAKVDEHVPAAPVVKSEKKKRGKKNAAKGDRSKGGKGKGGSAKTDAAGIEMKSEKPRSVESKEIEAVEAPKPVEVEAASIKTFASLAREMGSAPLRVAHVPRPVAPKKETKEVEVKTSSSSSGNGPSNENNNRGRKETTPMVVGGTIIVDGFTKGTNKVELVKLFKAYGIVGKVNVVKDGSHAFVDFKDAESVNQSISAAKKGEVKLNGQRLVVNDKKFGMSKHSGRKRNGSRGKGVVKGGNRSQKSTKSTEETAAPLK